MADEKDIVGSDVVHRMISGEGTGNGSVRLGATIVIGVPGSRDAVPGAAFAATGTADRIIIVRSTG